MSINLYCYTNSSTSDVDVKLNNLCEEFSYLFSTKYLIYPSDYVNGIKKTIALDHGFEAVSYFLVCYNDKTALDLAPKVIEVIKEAFGEDHILILFENESKL